MGLPLLEELVEFEENEIIFGNFWADEDIELWNIPADNHKYGMIIHNGETEVYRDGKLIRKGEGKIKIKRNEWLFRAISPCAEVRSVHGYRRLAKAGRSSAQVIKHVIDTAAY